METTYKPRLQVKYKEEVIGKLRDEFKYDNVMQVPKLLKVVLNMGVKEGATDIKVLENVARELTLIAGQKPVITKAKKSIAGFKLRAGVSVGLKVTLRNHRMYEFIDRLITVAMPRIRDFRGYSPKSFDKQGNYTFGIKEQMIFPEVPYDEIKKTQGMDVTFVTSAKNADEARKLLEFMGFPFQKKN